MSWLSFSSLLHFFAFFVTCILFLFFPYSFIFCFLLHFNLSLSFVILNVSRTWTQRLSPLQLLFFGSKIVNLVFVLAPFFISLLIYSSISNILNVSSNWTLWLTTLQYSHVLTILKQAAYMTMPKCLICKCFFCSLSIRLSKNKRDKKPSTNIRM